ncbi:hypothetical protein PC122_g10716 [Phytophthora cactorum]|nr:hypothetical protein PC122_g10716 [Phytophthora cactorum]
MSAPKLLESCVMVCPAKSSDLRLPSQPMAMFSQFSPSLRGHIQQASGAYTVDAQRTQAARTSQTPFDRQFRRRSDHGELHLEEGGGGGFYHRGSKAAYRKHDEIVAFQINSV